MIFWHPKGWTLYRTLRGLHAAAAGSRAAMSRSRRPRCWTASLWEASGHWEKFGHNMFVCETDGGRESWPSKPMNCPGHVQIFNHGQRSYRDPPLRMAEFGACHRYEPSGSLHGIVARARLHPGRRPHLLPRGPDRGGGRGSFVAACCRSVYADFGLRAASGEAGPAARPALRHGRDLGHRRGHAASAPPSAGGAMEVELAPGEGAFYGLKLEFHLRDAIGRTWQCGTLQLDYVLPERLDAYYIGRGRLQASAGDAAPGAFCGSLERFLGVMIEHYAGAFPLWLAPVQVVVATITSDADDYARSRASRRCAAGLAGGDWICATRRSTTRSASTASAKAPGDRRRRPPRGGGGQGGPAAVWGRRARRSSRLDEAAEETCHPGGAADADTGSRSRRAVVPCQGAGSKWRLDERHRPH